MKFKNLFSAMVLSLAVTLCGGVFADEPTGNIHGIHPVEVDTAYPNKSRPLDVGDEIYILVRLLNEDWFLHDSDPENSLIWEFRPASARAAAQGETLTTLNEPSLGISIGGKRYDAAYTPRGPNYEESGRCPENPRYTDLYFVYKVQAGDLGGPVKLLRIDGRIAAPAMASTDFLLKNVNTFGYETDATWNLTNSWTSAEEPHLASFHYDPDPYVIDGMKVPTYPSLPSGTLGPVRPIAALEPAVYVRTINFEPHDFEGKKWEEGAIWREVREGSTEVVGDYAPSLEGKGDTAVYVWTDDDSIAYVGDEEDWVTDPKCPYSKVAKVNVADGRAVFTLHGVQQGKTVTVRMSKTYNFKDVGDTMEDSTFSRVIRVVEPPKPKIIVKGLVDGQPADKCEITATNTYADLPPLHLKVTLSQAYAENLVVSLNPKFDGIDLETAHPTNGYIRILNVEAWKPDAASEMTVTVKAGETSADAYVYVLGKPKVTGVRNPCVWFTPSVEDPDAREVYTGDPDIFKLTVKDMAPAILRPVEGQVYNTREGSTLDELEIELADNWRDLQPSLATNGYSVSVTFANWGGGFSTNGLALTELNSVIDKLPVVVPASGDSEATIKIIDPTGNSSTRHVLIRSNPKPEVRVQFYADKEMTKPISGNTFQESDEVYAGVVFVEGQSPASPLYAFFEPADANASNLVVCAAKSNGVEIATASSSKTNSTVTLMRFKDGYNKDAMMHAEFNIVFRNARTWEASSSAGDYTEACGSPRFAVEVANDPCEIPSVTLDEGVLTKTRAPTNVVPAGVTVMARAELDDVSEIDCDATNPAKAIWTMWKWTDGETGFDSEEITTAYATNQTSGYAECPLIFYNQGVIQRVEVYALDKDERPAGKSIDQISARDWGEPKFTFYVNVADKPYVTFYKRADKTSKWETDPYTEDREMEFFEPGSDRYTFIDGTTTGDIGIGLSKKPGASWAGTKIDSDHPLVVEIELQKWEDGNVEISTNRVYFTNPANVTAQPIKLNVDTLNGARATTYTLYARVISEEKDKYGEKWSEHYLPASATVRVYNVDPKIVSVTRKEGEGAWGEAVTNQMNAGDIVTLNWTVSDNTNDFVKTSDHTFTLVWSGVSPTDGKLYPSTCVITNGWPVTATAKRAVGKISGEHQFTIPAAVGVHEIRLDVYDGDSDIPVTKSWWVYVAPSKGIRINLRGPAGTTETKYNSAAKGLGRGYVATLGTSTPPQCEGFKQGWFYTESSIEAQVFAWGYPSVDMDDPEAVAKAVDDGTLPKQRGSETTSIALSRYGTKWIAGLEYFNWATLNGGDPEAGRYDNYFYRWVMTASGEEGGEADPEAIKQQPTLDPNISTPLAVPLATEPNDKGEYPTVCIEAIFSRELREKDNLGDINADGIPDAYLPLYDMTGVGYGNFPEDDLLPLDDFNDDEDYYPLTSEESTYSTLIPGRPETWVTLSSPFTAVEEIRGMRTGPGMSGLNDAPNLVGVPGRLIDPDYASEDVEKRKLARDYSPLEMEAWADVDYDVNWSPERPTDPTKDDTDRDKMPDGYEYYFWYRAHVGYWDSTGVHRYKTGRRYDPKNPGAGKFIESAEIALLMDPRSDLEQVDFPKAKLDLSAGKSRDTDNDGLPDLLEMEIGTDPFDFDTDGDGLPDGWEIIVAGTSPLTAYTTPGISDAMRNFDGDAMAFNTPELERTLTLPTNYHVEDPYVFALEDADGDSDGVQWYTTKFKPAITNSAVTVTGALLRVDGGSVTNFYMTTATHYRIADNVLMTDLLKSETWQVEPVVNFTNSLPSLDGVTYQYIRLAPMAIRAGVRFLEDPTPDVEFGLLALAESAPELDCNAAWYYGSSEVPMMTTGQDTANMGGFGMLALGRYQGAPAGVPLTALPRTYSNLAYLHYLVYQEWGFDPRTAWNANTPLAPRWAKKKTTGTGDSQTSETYDNISQGSYAGMATRTREFTTYDEFLLYSFWINNGCETPLSENYVDVLALVNRWLAQTTNPQGPNEPDLDTDGMDSENGSVPYHGRNSDNGADTDMDGVPDGWELYVMTGPKYNLMGMKLCYVFAGPNGSAPNANAALFPMVAGDTVFGHMSPLVAEAASTKTDNKLVSGDEDDLSELQEYAGTDSCAYYSESASEETAPFSTTIVRPAEHANWLNKFFPTDPWAADTDHDGVTDYGEFEGGRAMVKSHSFVYGTPADDGSQCIVGGGLNPCSVDTDRDGLPDGWESQYPGQTIYDEGYAIAHNLIDADGKPIIDYGLPEGAEGGRGNPLQGLVDGMDGTVPDAFNTPYKNYSTANGDGTYSASKIISINGARQVVDRDYDHDGLSNWQEYLTGAMRCWRYDDPFSPWGYVPTEDWFIVEGETNEFSIAKAMAAVGTDDPGEFWYKTLVDKSSPYYAPRLQTGTGAMSQYFTWLDPRKYGFDPAYSDTGSYYIFFSRIGDDNLADWWGGEKGLNIEGDFPKEPSRYISTSPIEADSDHDGMDDYYELFHGMNPLLGESGVTYESDGPCDLVFDAWKDTGTNKAFHDAEDNYWTRNPSNLLHKTPRCKIAENMYDFELFPWLNGAANADPDGDDIRNQQESVMPMVAPMTIWHHTDPTPLWMTDSSYTNSLVTRFFRVAITPKPLSLGGESFTYNGETYYFCELTGGYYIDPMEGPKLKPYTPDQWLLTGSAAKKNWIFSFEENEGYDSDHDVVGDYEEIGGKFMSATDPKDFDAPHRRQAMYFPGQNAALQSMPYVEEQHPVGHTGYPDDMTFVQYTIECWVYPERDTDQTIIERACWVTFSNPGDQELLKKNFHLGVKQGRWYTMFDPDGTVSNRQVEVIGSQPIKLNAWTHLAATYDTKELRLYVNGFVDGRQPSNLMPAYGSSALAIYPGDSLSQKAELNNAKGNMYWFDRKLLQKAILVGASFKGLADGERDINGNHLTVLNGRGWSHYKKFFKGYVDEVRIWDGARSSQDILDSMKVRYTADLVKENRDEFYNQWVQGNRRYMKDTNGNDCQPIPELIFHWSFDSIPGAASPEMVAKMPFGFGEEGPKAYLSRPEGYEIPWWSKVLAGYTGTVYGYPAWIQWIPNTVTHLPRYDLTTLDSMYWSENFAGDQAGSYKFARSAEPVSMWTQMTRNKVLKDDDFYSTDRRYWQVYTAGTNQVSNLTKLFEFTGRHLNQMGDDLLPLGGAFVKYADVMWDEQGPSTSWEITGSDADNDGLPDWWSEYAKDNYRRDDMDPGDEITWDTIINYHGRLMTAGEAYLYDLAKGYYVDENGEIVTDPELAAKRQQTADEDADGMADWWENAHGIQNWKMSDAMDDPDNDGLANFSEYVITTNEVAELDPRATKSDGKIIDYFLKIGSHYLGELYTDFDMVEDWWEDQWENLKYSSHDAWDALSDSDGDGWSLWAERRSSAAKAGTLANLVSHLVSTTETPDMPMPTIKMTIRYNGNQLESASQSSGAAGGSSGGATNAVSAFRILAYTDRNLVQPNATFTVEPGKLVSKELYIGAWENRIVRGTLAPGHIDFASLDLKFGQILQTDKYSWTDEAGKHLAASYEEFKQAILKNPDILQNVIDFKWYSLVPPENEFTKADRAITVSRDGILQKGYINLYGERVGTIDLETGDFEFDLGALTEVRTPYVYDEKKGDAAAWSYEEGVFKLIYQAVVPQFNRHETTFTLCKPDEGYLREGKNNFLVFADLSGEGNFSPDEPFGFVRDVEVGWDRVPELTVELTDEAACGLPRVMVPQDLLGAAVPVSIKRIGVNGQMTSGRTVMNRLMDFTRRDFLTEADVIRGEVFDLDWRRLNASANDTLESATYELTVGDPSATNRLVTVFTRTFSATNHIQAVAKSPSEGVAHRLQTAQPTFVWEGEPGYTAFEIEVSDANTNTIWRSGTCRMPAKGDEGYAYTAPIYVGRELTDGTNYQWRVAQHNAKFKKSGDGVWSKWAVFETMVENDQLVPVCGKVAVDARYYGSEDDVDATNVIVGVYANADFTGDPVASVRLAAGELANLAVTNMDDFAAAATNNLVMLAGIEPGDYYLMAFIDRNYNGRRDVYESWGYLNQIGLDTRDLYNPVAVTIKASAAKPEKKVLFMEDTDINDNGIPDCEEPLADLDLYAQKMGGDLAPGGDADGDGLTNGEEEDYGSDPYDPYSLWKRNGADETLKYTDKEAIDFCFDDGDLTVDDDMDGLTNWQEFLACRKDTTLGLKVDDPMSDGLTNDYFRVYAGNTGYSGEENGAEWIEYAARDFFGMNNLSRAGTRDLLNEGWDMWSISRYILNGGQIVQWNAIGDGGATTNANEISYEPLPEIKVTLTYRGGGSKDVRFAAYQGPLMDLENDFPATEWASAVGFDNGIGKVTLSISNRVEETGTLKQGPARIVAYIDNDGDGKFSCADSFGMAETEIGWANHELEIRMGDPCAALPAFEFGDGSNFVSQVTIVRTRINGVPMLNPHTVFKRRYANNIERATLFPEDYVLSGMLVEPGESEEADPAKKRTKTTNVTHIGLDYNLCNEKYANVDSVTYEVLVGPGPFTVSNLTEYATLLARTNSEGKVAYSTNYVTTSAANMSFTVNYSQIRDIPQVIVSADQLKSTAEISFTVPTDTPATKFWIRLDDEIYPAEDGTTIGKKTYTRESGFLIPAAAQGLATIKLADYISQDLVASQEYTIQIALGNDRFGAPDEDKESDWSAKATFKVNEVPAWNGKIAVEVRNDHLSQTNGWVWKKVVVAAYDTPDLVNPVSLITNGATSAFTLSGLRAGQRYYVAAWYVKDAEDGRDQSLRIRQPYDTWGYATLQGESPLCFNAAPIAAVKGEPTAADAVTVYLQDTDWNGNFKIDRLEDFKAVNGFAQIDGKPGSPWIEFWDDFDLNGLPDVWEDAQPEEEEEKKIVSDDVMAYYEIPNMTFVALGKDGGETNWIWCAVFDANDPTASYRLTDGTIKLQTPADQIPDLYSTYSYYGTGISTAKTRDPRKWEGIGTNVSYSAEWKVQEIRIGKAKFVHAQVYALFGYEPETCVPGSDHHTKAFTKSDKYLVCRYLQSIGVQGVDETMMLTNIAYQWMWTLKDKVIDSDRDGIADGWELYTMFGPTNYTLKGGVRAFTAENLAASVEAKIVSPFTTEDGMAPAPGSGSGLKLIEEYDNGHFPTDPWSVDTDGDGILDYYAYWYVLKGEDAAGDFDGDGLSNYAEYLISEVFAFAKLDPRNPKTDGACLDYFRKVGDLYFGEVFTDHDRMNDIWEDTYLTAHDRYIYNPDDDPDLDGWSNYAEYRAGTNPMKEADLSLVNGAVEWLLEQYPVPTVKAVVDGCDGSQGLNIRAWRDDKDPSAEWTVPRRGDATIQSVRYLGLNDGTTVRIQIGPGECAKYHVWLEVLDPHMYDVDDQGEITLYDSDTAEWTRVGEDDPQIPVDEDGGFVFGRGGSVNYVTGAITVDLSNYQDTDYRILIDENTVRHLDLTRSFVRVCAQCRIPGETGAQTLYFSKAQSGSLKEGANSFTLYANGDDKGDYTPGEPLGVVTDVDVGWASAAFSATLTKTTAITPRIGLWSGLCDREVTHDGFLSSFNVLSGEHRLAALKYPGTNDAQKIAAYVAAIENRVDTSRPPEDGKLVRVRVVRYGIDDYFAYQCGIYSAGLGTGFDQRVVLDKTFDPADRTFLCEQDFLGDGRFDIDWDTMQADKVVDNNGNPGSWGAGTGPASLGCSVTNMTYLIVLGDGKKDFRGGEDTNTVRALTQMITRRFEKKRSTPVAEDLGIVHGARPTFVWSMPNEDRWASEFGSTYTAFRIQICNATGNKVIYDSGIHRAPAQVRKNGKLCFVWTADAYAGDQTALGKMFYSTGDYTWKVSMYNAKFRSDAWSNVATFSTAVNAQQGVNDNGYSAVNVAVKYAGPDSILERVMDDTDPKGTIRIQAFETADFSGEPVAQGYTIKRDSIIDTSKLEPNARLIGLPARGTYYIRAYIDMNGNRQLDNWESWGYVKEPVVLGNQVKEPSVGLFIEDADTDNDLVPDAYEYAAAGWKDDFDDIKHEIVSAVDDEGKILFTAEGYDVLKTGLASLSTGLSGSSLTLMMNQWFKDMISGPGSVELTADEARAMVLRRTCLLDNTVRITAFSLDPNAKKGYIYVDGEVQTDTAGQALMKKYGIELGSVEVKVNVYMVDSLAKQWPTEPQWTKPAKIGTDKSCIDVDLSDIDFSSGFFKVEIVK